MLCLKHHKAVFVEKPIAMNEKQCHEMLNLAKQNGVFLMEALWTRFIPSFKKCKELVEGGAGGDVTLIHADFCIQPPYDTKGRLFNPMLGRCITRYRIISCISSLTLAGKPIELNAQHHFVQPASIKTVPYLLSMKRIFYRYSTAL
jgi:hypothetical protein